MNFKTANPIVHEINVDVEILVSSLLSLAAGRYLTILDSGKTDGKGAKLLIAGFDPFLLIESRGGNVLIEDVREGKSEVYQEDVLKILDERLKAFGFIGSNSFPERFAGGCVATLSYDLGLGFEKTLSHLYSKRQHEEPDAFFAFYDTFIVHDYSTRKTFIVGCGGKERIRQTEDTIKGAGKILSDEDLPLASVSSNTTRAKYVRSVEKIKEHIAAGDIYQANLTQQLVCELSSGVKAEQIFTRLRRQHPAPFGAFIQRREDVVISASPERFLSVRETKEGKIIEACPIKGTRPRGRDREEDERLRAELLESEKDRAENIMIVDLLRNDIGRICEYGSVVVDELCVLHEYPSLFHLVSKVRGKLKDDVSVSDLLRATFPCGSITGAPKIRAMEIIDELEPAPRGLSMGAIGYFSFSGAMDLNVAIRTLVVRDGVARFNVGGGVVADSVAANEYEESLVKAVALMNALNARFSAE